MEKEFAVTIAMNQCGDIFTTALRSYNFNASFK